MQQSPSEMLKQTCSDIIQILQHGARADCRTLSHGGIALSGQKAADLNMVFLTNGATRGELEEGLLAVRDKGVDALLIVEEGADDIRGWASEEGLTEVGQMPLMERGSASVEPPNRFSVRIADPGEMPKGNRLAAAAFSLDEDECNKALPADALKVDGNELWIAERDGETFGCGIFVRSGGHVGVYTMSTPPEHQRKGVGAAVLAAAMAHHQSRGAERFTLGATEKGYPLYERVGFEVVTRPYVYVIGASTQFPGH
jgi:GNAT superfamily N-acetyltransferase